MANADSTHCRSASEVLDLVTQVEHWAEVEKFENEDAEADQEREERDRGH